MVWNFVKLGFDFSISLFVRLYSGLLRSVIVSNRVSYEYGELSDKSDRYPSFDSEIRVY